MHEIPWQAWGQAALAWVRALPDAGLIAVLAAASLLGAFVLARIVRALECWRVARCRRIGRAGERAAEALVAAAGYRVAGRQVTRRFDVLVDGEPRAATVRADLLLQKNGRTFVAEIKSGWLVSDPLHAPTRRQLLEYEVAFGARGVLLVDVPRKAVRRVEFPLARGVEARPERRGDGSGAKAAPAAAATAARWRA